MAQYDFLIFGASGMQGRIVTRDLIESGYSVFLSSKDTDGIEATCTRYGVPGETADLNNELAILALVSRIHPRVIVNCAEGDWNMTVYRAALAVGAHVIDLGSTIPVTKEQFALHDAFAQKDLCAITGCGSTPGINNVALALAVSRLDSLHTVEAGFVWDSNIKKFTVPFSMESVVEEFTDSADVLENGIWKQVNPMDTIEWRTFQTIDPQRCFMVRHPEAFTFHDAWKKNGLKTVRFFAGFPDHSFSFIKKIIETKKDVPLGELTRVLEKLHPYPEGYQERENLWVIVDGVANDKPTRIMTECLVKTLPGWENAGCNIDTGFPAVIIAQMLLDGTITARGSFAPDTAVPPKPFFQRLARRGMYLYIDGQRYVA